MIETRNRHMRKYCIFYYERTDESTEKRFREISVWCINVWLMESPHHLAAAAQLLDSSRVVPDIALISKVRSPPPRAGDRSPGKELSPEPAASSPARVSAQAACSALSAVEEA